LSPSLFPDEQTYAIFLKRASNLTILLKAMNKLSDLRNDSLSFTV